jgi:hypothetical protein
MKYVVILASLASVVHVQRGKISMEANNSRDMPCLEGSSISMLLRDFIASALHPLSAPCSKRRLVNGPGTSRSEQQISVRVSPTYECLSSARGLSLTSFWAYLVCRDNPPHPVVVPSARSNLPQTRGYRFYWSRGDKPRPQWLSAGTPRVVLLLL